MNCLTNLLPGWNILIHLTNCWSSTSERLRLITCTEHTSGHVTDVTSGYVTDVTSGHVTSGHAQWSDPPHDPPQMITELCPYTTYVVLLYTRYFKTQENKQNEEIYYQFFKLMGGHYWKYLTTLIWYKQTYKNDYTCIPKRHCIQSTKHKQPWKYTITFFIFMGEQWTILDIHSTMKVRTKHICNNYYVN